MDKNKAVVKFLMTCPSIVNNPLFYNFGKVGSDNQQVQTLENDVRTNTPFVDGSVSKAYQFTLIVYKAVSDRAILNREGASDENLDSAFEVQQILDWVNAQAKARNFPNFGENCVIDTMLAVTNEPNLNGVDKAVTPVLAKYSISIRIEYIDYSESIWV